MKSFVALFLALCSIMAVVNCQEDYRQVYCGKRLASTLALLCENTFLVKRNMVQEMPMDFHWPWMVPQRANSLGRSKRQVVSECCEKPCSIDELLSYC